MKALIVHAHPEANSFSAALKNKAIETFENLGYSVALSDLYTMGFDPVGDKIDFTSLQNPDYFKYQLEQLHANEHNLFSEDVRIEMKKFEEADVVMFNFPLWWFDVPAIMKGWFDRVFAMGFAYGGGKGVYDNGAFKNKKSFLSITTGGPEIAYAETGKNGTMDQVLFSTQHGRLYFVGMEVLEPFISYGPARLTDEERALELERLSVYIDNLESQPKVYS